MELAISFLTLLSLFLTAAVFGLRSRMNAMQAEVGLYRQATTALNKWAEGTVEPDIISLSDTLEALLSYYNLEVYEFVGEDGVKYTLLEQDDGSYKDEEDV